MNVTSFLQNFRTVANAPNGISQLRILVYHLAFRGLLVEHGDDNAKYLLDQLVASNRESSAGRRSESAIATPFYAVPDHWLWVNIGLIGHDWGQAKPKDEFTYIDVSSIDNRKGVIRRDVSVVTATRAPSRARKLVRKGTVVYSTVRPYLLNIAIVDEDFNPPPIASTAFAILHPYDGVDARYVYHYLRSPAFVQYVESVQSGIAYPAISDRKFFAASFPLPPLEEQKRIVAKVDELMRLCDRLEAQQQEREKLLPLLSRASHARFVASPTPTNLQAIFHQPGTVSPEDLRDTICSLAVAGYLVPRVSDEGDAAEILARADVEKVTLDDAPKLPSHWQWVRLGAVATTMNSGWSPACPPQPATADQWGVLKTTAVQPLEYLEGENKRIPLNLEPRPEAEVQDGDILFTRAGPKNRVGILCVAKPTRPRLMISDKIIRLHLVDGIIPDFAALVLNTGYSSYYIETLKSGMATSQMNVSQPKLRSVPLPVPPTDEQKRILQRTKQLLQLIGRLATLRQHQDEVAEAFAKAAVAAITATEFTEMEKMKPPKTEVATTLKVNGKPKKRDAAPLTAILAGQQGELSAKELWNRSGLEIDAFYRQLKIEMTNGWIVEPTQAFVKEVEAG